MATSNYFSTSNVGVDYKIIVLETATSATNNTSTITVQVLARRNKAGTVVDYDGECIIKINGYQQTSSSWSKTQKPISYGSDTEIFSGTFTIPHNADGSKTVHVAACFMLYSEGEVKLSCAFKGFDVALTTLRHNPTVLSTVGTLVVDSGVSKIELFACVYNATNVHTLVIKNGATTVLTISSLSLSDGKNEVTLTNEQKQTILTYLINNDLVTFVATYELTTYYGSTQIGTTSTHLAVIRTNLSGGSTTMSIRKNKVGINNTNPAEALDVDGNIKCDRVIMNDPNYEVVGKKLIINSSFPLYRVEDNKLIIIR